MSTPTAAKPEPVLNQASLAPAAVLETPPPPSRPVERVRVKGSYTFFDPARPQAGIDPFSGQVLDARSYVKLEPGQAWLDGKTIINRETGEPIMHFRWGGAGDPRQAANNTTKGFGAYRHPETQDAIVVGDMVLLARSPSAESASEYAKLTEMTARSSIKKNEEMQKVSGAVADAVTGKVLGELTTLSETDTGQKKMEEAVKEASKKL